MAAMQDLLEPYYAAVDDYDLRSRLNAALGKTLAAEASLKFGPVESPALQLTEKQQKSLKSSLSGGWGVLLINTSYTLSPKLDRLVVTTTVSIASARRTVLLEQLCLPFCPGRQRQRRVGQSVVGRSGRALSPGRRRSHRADHGHAQARPGLFCQRPCQLAADKPGWQHDGAGPASATGPRDRAFSERQAVLHPTVSADRA
jgi:hypothetical protein